MIVEISNLMNKGRAKQLRARLNDYITAFKTGDRKLPESIKVLPKDYSELVGLARKTQAKDEELSGIMFSSIRLTPYTE